MKLVKHVALTGYPSAGKTEIGHTISNKGGYRYISNDMIRKELYGDIPPFSLSYNDWFFIYSDFNARKHLRLSRGENVVTDSCPYSNILRRLTLYISPEMKKIFEQNEQELKRYLVVLIVTRDEIIRRNRQRGRIDPISHNYIDDFTSMWEDPKNLDDEFGPIEILEYENNTRQAQGLILKDLEEKLNL